MAKTLTKRELDNPKRWVIHDRWHDALLWGALHGIFDLKEDKKVMKAFHANDLVFVKKATERRIAKVGKGKPKFKKVPAKKLGYDAVTINGSRAYAASILNEKIFGKPKPLKKSKKAEKPKKKIKPKKQPHKNPENPPDPSLPQNNAYEQARKKVKKGEILLYIYLKKYPVDYVAVYAKNKKKFERKITAKLPPVDEKMQERGERYGNRVAMYYAVKDAIRVNGKVNGKLTKAKPKKSRM